MQRELLTCDAKSPWRFGRRKKTLSGSFAIVTSFKLKAKQNVQVGLQIDIHALGITKP